ncbi:MAG TPA: TlpA disulfide reductase family protein [Saprospiraceae bacterium]|nr:TlpA disulfide reductase family protein [Saprospiraceae bacterium]HMQ83435.1 TlpA disulfide reductase family protein [Saprospiraceae bacterium]
MKWLSYFSVVLLLLSTNCTGQAPLSGKLQLDEGWAPQVYLIQPRHLDEIATSFVGQVIDSASINADGSFVFEELPNAPDPVLLELVVQPHGTRFANKLENENPMAANYFPIIWKNGDRLQVEASIAQFQSSFSIENPSSGNAALLRLRAIRLAAFQRLKPTTEHDETQLLEEEAALLSFQQPMMDFAQQTDELLAALLAVRWISPVNDYERIPEFLFAQCQKWQSIQGEHPWVGQLCEKASREQLPILINDQLPDAALPMLAGDTVTLHAVIANKRLTLLDIWASWCAPCRRENRAVLLPLWEKHHEKGFEIVGYALDASEKAWKKALETDGADRWLHASHLQGDDAPLLATLRIQTIPANFLLDARGKVIAKNLHGQDLVEFVDHYMEK